MHMTSDTANDRLGPLANEWIDGLHPYEAGRPIEDVARALGIRDVEAIDKLASNENVLGPSPRAVAAMRDAAPLMHLYPDGGAYYLKEKLADRLRVTPEQILMTHGSNEGIELLGHAFLQPGRGMVMSERAFVVYRLVAELFQAEVKLAPMDGFTHDLGAMAAAIDERTRLVFIANPNNPTGTMVSGEEIDRFMDRIPDHVAVVIDEAYRELLPPDQQPDTMQYVHQGRPIFLLRTFSKAYGLAGLRLGYVVSTPTGIGLLNRTRQPFNVNAMAQAAALAALDDEPFLERTRTLVRNGLNYLGRQCDARGWSYVPSVANFVLIDVGRGREVFEQLQTKKIIVRAMDGYGLPDHIRVTVGTREQNERLIAALQDVVAARP